MILKINGSEFPIIQMYSVSMDADWQFRYAYFVKIRTDYATANALFIDGATWSVIDGETETDHSDFCVAGKIVDYRNGDIGVYMGRKTETERLEEELADAKKALALLGINDTEVEENVDGNGAEAEV